MVQEYFVYNGKQYNSGTLIYVMWASSITRTMCKTLATFGEHNVDRNIYTFSIDGYMHSRSEVDFYNMLCGIYGEISVNNIGNLIHKKLTFNDEIEIEGMLVSWIWYIVIMAVAIIFKERILIWVFASIIFFSYRNKKLKEAGYK